MMAFADLVYDHRICGLYLLPVCILKDNIELCFCHMYIYDESDHLCSSYYCVINVISPLCVSHHMRCVIQSLLGFFLCNQCYFSVRWYHSL